MKRGPKCRANFFCTFDTLRPVFWHKVAQNGPKLGNVVAAEVPVQAVNVSVPLTLGRVKGHRGHSNQPTPPYRPRPIKVSAWFSHMSFISQSSTEPYGPRLGRAPGGPLGFPVAPQTRVSRLWIGGRGQARTSVSVRIGRFLWPWAGPNWLKRRRLPGPALREP